MSNLKLPIQQALKLLLDEGYIYYNTLQERWLLAAKAIRELDEVSGLSIVREDGVVVLPSTSIPLSKATLEDWKNLFTKFILEAKVPRFLEGKNGDQYYGNKYSETGFKVFRKALEQGKSYELLVQTVQLYYQSKVKLKKAVGNYFAHGDWLTDYQALELSAQSGSSDQHVKRESSGNNSSGWKFG